MFLYNAAFSGEFSCNRQTGSSFFKRLARRSGSNSRFLSFRIFAYSVFAGSSSFSQSGSTARSPLRFPIIFISMSFSGSRPLNFIICLARSIIFIGSPISRRYDSLFFPTPPVLRTREQASGIVIKYRSISSEVTVTGPPFFICSIKSGRIDPRLPRTFPKRTNINFFSLFSLFLLPGQPSPVQKDVSEAFFAASRTSFSQIIFETP